MYRTQEGWPMFEIISIYPKATEINRVVNLGFYLIEREKAL